MIAKDFVVASIGLTWFSSALTVDKVVERYLHRLQDVSRRISEQL